MSGDKDRGRDPSGSNHPRADAERRWRSLNDTKLTSATSRQAGKPRPLRVLLAEDNEPNALLAIAVMQMLGCEVTIVGTGEEAVRAVKQEPFDIVLMDFHMPVMDGLEATRAIREWESDPGRVRDSRNVPRIPIIAITASAMPPEREQCLAAGMDEVLVKPFRLDDLREVLERWAG